MMAVAVRRSRTENDVDDERAAALATAFFRASLYDLILCHDELEVDALRRWETILKGGAVSDYSITRYYRAIARAKGRTRNPTNIVAFLVYRMSHGGHPERPGLEADDGSEREGRRCIACGVPLDEERRERMVERIEQGERLNGLRTPFDCEELVDTHLTQEEVSRFVDHEVSFSYQERMIERIYQELEQEETDARLSGGG